MRKAEHKDPSAGAQRAARAIVGGIACDEDKAAQMDMARIIDRETCAVRLAEALARMYRMVDEGMLRLDKRVSDKPYNYYRDTITMARAALEEWEGRSA